MIKYEPSPQIGGLGARGLREKEKEVGHKEPSAFKHLGFTTLICRATDDIIFLNITPLRDRTEHF